MARRYLNPTEIESAFARGKSVECFIGRCDRNGALGVRWLSLRKDGGSYRLSIYESADIGDENFFDLYEFGPLDPILDFDEPDVHLNFGSLTGALEEIDVRFPSARDRMVNEGVIQDEYRDFVLERRRLES